MNLDDIIFNNDDLRYFSELTPHAEGDSVFDFLEEAKEAHRAIAASGAIVREKRARRLFLVRAIYFLGVQRGAEAYRIHLGFSDEIQMDFDKMEFELSESWADDCAWELNHLSRGELEKLCAEIGI